MVVVAWYAFCFFPVMANNPGVREVQIVDASNHVAIVALSLLQLRSDQGGFVYLGGLIVKAPKKQKRFKDIEEERVHLGLDELDATEYGSRYLVTYNTSSEGMSKKGCIQQMRNRVSEVCMARHRVTPFPACDHSTKLCSFRSVQAHSKAHSIYFGRQYNCLNAPAVLSAQINNTYLMYSAPVDSCRSMTQRQPSFGLPVFSTQSRGHIRLFFGIAPIFNRCSGAIVCQVWL